MKSQICVSVDTDALKEARSQKLNVSRVCSDALAYASLKSIQKEKEVLQEKEKALRQQQELCMQEMRKIGIMQDKDITDEMLNFWSKGTGLTTKEVKNILLGVYGQ